MIANLPLLLLSYFVVLSQFMLAIYFRGAGVVAASTDSPDAPIYQRKYANQSCPCFVSMAITQAAGIGHRLFEWLIGLRIAYELECTFAMPNYAALFGSGNHGEYKAIGELLDLSADEFLEDFLFMEPWNSTILRTLPLQYPFERKTSDVNRCHTKFTFHAMACPSAPGSWCFQEPGLIDGVFFVLREKFLRHVEPSFCNDFEDAVVLHLRVGDIIIDWGFEYYDNILRAAAAVIERNNLTKRLVIVHECPHCAANSLYHPHAAIFRSICAQYKFDCSFAPHLDAYNSIRRMVCAELLVTSGSSFSMIAAALTRSPVIFARNKDTSCPRCCGAPWHIFPTDSGHIVGAELAKLDSQMRTRMLEHQLYHINAIENLSLALLL